MAVGHVTGREISPGLRRYLNCNGIHDQGHKFRNDIVDIQFVELKANTSDSYAFSLCLQRANSA